MTDDLSTLSPVQRWRRALRALARVVANPDETDQVLEFLTMINGTPKVERLARFFDDPRGAKLYAEARAIDSRLDLDALAALPADTLGHAYATFLRSHGLTPDIFDGSPPGISDPRVAYVIQRMRQTHDLWHVVTGHETDPFGEVALQAFTYAQIRAPGSLVLAAVGTLRGTRHRPTLVREVVAAYRAGTRAAAMPPFPWEDHWATPLAEVRALLGISPRAAA